MLRLMAILAHPDDESLGFGGTLAKYASEGVQTFLLTATRGERGRYYGHPYTGPGGPHPGAAELGRIREAELHAAALALDITDVALLDYEDQSLDRADPSVATAAIVSHLRRVRPDVVMTFAPDGAYGHPDHIAISQLTAAAIVAAADPSFASPDIDTAPPAHRVAKLYYLAWSRAMWMAYEAAFHKLVSNVDGEERQANPWPDWAITTTIDTKAVWATVWKAVSLHESQVSAYERLQRLAPEHHESLWGSQSFYRAFSFVNGGRGKETDLFAGLRSDGGTQHMAATKDTQL